MNDSPKEDAEYTAFLARHTVTRRFAKGSLLQAEGDVRRKAFWVRKGLLRSYALDGKGKEHIFMFAPEGWLMTDVATLAKGVPAQLTIEALEDSEVDVLGEKIFTDLARLPPEVARDQIGILLRRIHVLQKRVLSLLAAPAGERYLEFLETYPNISSRVPQRMVASYLGVTPEALSQIKSRMGAHHGLPKKLKID